MFKKTLIAATMASLSLAATGAYAANGFYVSGFGGGSYLKSVKGNKFDIGYNAGGAVGYKKGPFRVEGEVAHTYNKQKEQNVKIHTTSLMANVYYDFDNVSKKITPYVGAGLGESFIRSTAAHKGHTHKLALQGIVGGKYHLNKQVDLTADYRFLHATGGVSYNSHTLNVGVSYNFG